MADLPVLIAAGVCVCVYEQRVHKWASSVNGSSSSGGGGRAKLVKIKVSEASCLPCTLMLAHCLYILSLAGL